MIEKILLRIARRGPALTQLEPSDTSVTPSAYDQGSSRLFPTVLPQDGILDSLTSATITPAIWDVAKEAHYRAGAPEERATALPPAYAGYGMVHALIGSVIWSERKFIQKNIVHLVSRNGDVVAAVYPTERTVAVRKNPDDFGAGSLSIKVLPPTARAFEADQASSFDTISVHMLLWYFGQVVPEAVENIPDALLRGKMLLRKLPLVAPNALHTRHLRLISLFSAGPIYLQALFNLLNTESMESICADLTSLHLTGCLVSNDPKSNPV